MRYTYVNDH